MATYKVLQDIEAEDKLLGPLTLKQFIFGIITVVLGFIEFKLITSGGSIIIKLPLIFVFLLPMLIFGFMASPIGRDQPNDIWLLARLRYLFKPRKRLWDQNGLSELITITAPKSLETHFSNNLSQGEVVSRLHALANTLDSRGWAIKNINLNLNTQPEYLLEGEAGDRLINSADLPQDVSNVTVVAADDIMDEQNNPTAAHLDQMVQASTQSHRQQVLQSVSGNAQLPTPQPVAAPIDYAAPLGQTAPIGFTIFDNNTVVSPGAMDTGTPTPTANELSLVAQAVQTNTDKLTSSSGRLKNISPLGQPLPNNPVNSQPPSTNPAIIDLANNDDLNIATIARQAKRIRGELGDSEVVISLH